MLIYGYRQLLVSVVSVLIKTVTKLSVKFVFVPVKIKMLNDLLLFKKYYYYYYYFILELHFE